MLDPIVVGSSVHDGGAGHIPMAPRASVLHQRRGREVGAGIVAEGEPRLAGGVGVRIHAAARVPDLLLQIGADDPGHCRIYVIPEEGDSNPIVAVNLAGEGRVNGCPQNVRHSSRHGFSSGAAAVVRRRQAGVVLGVGSGNGGEAELWILSTSGSRECALPWVEPLSGRSVYDRPRNLDRVHWRIRQDQAGQE